MDLYIIRDGIFTSKDNKAASNLLHYDVFGKRYLDVFQQVNLVGRKFEKEDPTALPVEGGGVNFISLPGRNGILGFIKSIVNIISIALKTTKKGNSYILRIPGTIPSIYYFILKFKKIPFSVEVCADPLDSYSKKSLDGHILSKPVQAFFVWMVKLQCKNANASVYVTEFALQKRYPPGVPENSFSFTSIDLNNFRSEPRTAESFNIEQPLVSLIGNMQGSMKGHDVLINAIKMLKDEGIIVNLEVIGYGNNQTMFENLCVECGVEKQVKFLGKVTSGNAVLDLISKADLFVLPSRQEGLPRALLEAMTQGLPAIGTRVGGTPELLPESVIVEPDDSIALALKMKELLQNPKLLAQLSEINLNKSKEYSAETIREKRNSFLRKLKSISNAGN
jgi:glycosyltransferase involved in cell wall biosynthesis